MRSISAGSDYLRLQELRALRRYGNGFGFIVCAAMMGFALYLEHEIGLDPCLFCTYQRVPVAATGVLFLIGTLHASTGVMAWVYGLLASTTALVGAGVAALHNWTQAQPLGSVPASSSMLDSLLSALPFSEEIRTVLRSGECAKVDWALAGYSIPWWIAMALGSLSIWALVVNLKSE